MLASLFFFFNDTATTEIYTLSLHDALPICEFDLIHNQADFVPLAFSRLVETPVVTTIRSEEHTSELQSPDHLVCRLLLEKKKNTNEKREANTQTNFNFADEQDPK